MAKKISIVTPFFNEEDVICAYFKELLPVLCKLEHFTYEIVCVDDGSTDKTFELLEKEHQQHNAIQVIKLARNFGKEAALTAGLDYATGDVVIPMDGDLQHPPELIPEMLKAWENLNVNAVLMKRKARKESLVKKLTAKVFYAIINRLSKSYIPSDVGDFRLLDRKIVNAIKQLREKNRFMKGLLSWPGFSFTVMYYNQTERKLGKAKQNYKRLFSLAFNGIFSFSTVPLQLWSIIGFVISGISFFHGIQIVYKKLVHGIDLAGYPSLMVGMLFLNGLIMISIGILGEYIGRIYDEVKNRPIYVIDELLGKERSADE
ncbi:MAG: glycosyltransferase family 2 protein [Deltaproteobacteria bacterium]|nr:glycosyltransferase family 2 protein [Deltaproteobacteria bacterium]